MAQGLWVSPAFRLCLRVWGLRLRVECLGLGGIFRFNSYHVWMVALLAGSKQYEFSWAQGTQPPRC